jgi:hypothetical protein
MTVREHLKKAHEAIASHHRQMSECHKTALGKEMAGSHQHAFHKAAMAAHDHAAATHDGMLEECSKATADDLNKLVPIGERITPPAFAVPRPGFRPAPAPTAAAPAPEPEFAKLFAIETGDEEPLRQ